MLELGEEWILRTTPIRLAEVSSAPATIEIPPGSLSLYAKDNGSGVSALFYKDDAGNEKNLSGGLTGSGTANRLAYWSGSTTLAANAALTQNWILVADANGLPTGNASAQITGLTGDVTLKLNGSSNGIILIDGAATGNPYIEFQQSATFKGRLQYIDADDSFAFSVNGAEQLRLVSGGNLGLGTTTPNFSGFTRAFTILSGTNTCLELASSRADAASALLGSLTGQYRTNSTNHQRVAEVQLLGTGTTANQRGGTIIFLTKPDASTTLTERVRINHHGHLIQAESSSDPGTGDLTADAAIAIYTKNDKLVFAYNNGGTMTYIKLDLDGSDVTWAHDTTAP